MKGFAIQWIDWLEKAEIARPLIGDDWKNREGQLDTSKNRLFLPDVEASGMMTAFGRSRSGFSGAVSSVFWAGAPLSAPFSGYAGTPRPSSQTMRWKL
jgi:hypothetical protein